MKQTTTKLLQRINLDNSIRRKLLKRNIDSEDITNMKQQAYDLINITGRIDAKSYILLGKINLLESNNEGAKENFEKAIELNQQLPSSYYGLFKAYVNLGDYQKALFYIKQYSRLSNINVDIYIKLINNLTKDDQFTIKFDNTILGQRIKNIPLLRNYQLLVNYLNENDFNKALKHLLICVKLIKKYDYHIDLSYIEILILKVKNIVNASEVTELKHLLATSDNLGQRYLLLNQLYELFPDNINILYYLIEISLAFENDGQAIMYIKRALELEPHSNKLNHYVKIVNEKDKYLNTHSEAEKLKVMLTNLIDNENYQEAKNLCNESYAKTQNSYFIYAMGVIEFKQKMYKNAKKYFLTYLTTNSHYRLKESYYYLFYINYYLNDLDYKKYSRRILNLSCTDDILTSNEVFTKYLLEIHDFSRAVIIDIDNDIFTGNIELITKGKEKRKEL